MVHCVRDPLWVGQGADSVGRWEKICPQTHSTAPSAQQQHSFIRNTNTSVHPCRSPVNSDHLPQFHSSWTLSLFNCLVVYCIVWLTCSWGSGQSLGEASSASPPLRPLRSTLVDCENKTNANYREYEMQFYSLLLQRKVATLQKQIELRSWMCCDWHSRIGNFKFSLYLFNS